MALSIKTDEADRLARELARITGRSMTAVVTDALREKLERERADQTPKAIDWLDVDRILDRMREGADLTPITKAEMDEIVDFGIEADLRRHP